MKGALEWRMVSTTSVESMGWAPTEAKPTVSIVLDGGEISSPLLGTEGPSWRGAPEEARREGILNLGTILCPATVGQWEVVEPGPGKLSPGLPGAERSGETHTDKASATSAPSGPVREELDAWGRIRVDSETSLETQTDPLVPDRTPSISASPPRGGASIPRASAPVSTGFLLLYCESPGCELLEETTTSLGTTGGFGTPVSKGGRDCNPPLVIYIGDHQCVVWVSCRGLMYSSPKGITLDAAAIRPNSLWNCMTVSDWPSLILFTADIMDSMRAGDRRACIDVESHTTPRKVVLCSG